jgi:predicted PurR-regulated permease PerM
MIPSIALAFSVSPLIGGLSTVFCLAWSQLESNVITPRVMGRAVELHPLAVLLAVMIGSELLGVTGAILAIPVAASAAVILDELQAERLRQLAAGEAQSGVGSTRFD